LFIQEINEILIQALFFLRINDEWGTELTLNYEPKSVFYHFVYACDYFENQLSGYYEEFLKRTNLPKKNLSWHIEVVGIKLRGTCTKMRRNSKKQSLVMKAPSGLFGIYYNYS
jgi:hypothetical protein